MHKKKLLVFIDWFYPAFKAGGPIKSVSNITAALQTEADIFIVTSAYDLDGINPLEGILPNEWVKKGGITVIYLENQHQNRSNFEKLMLEVNPDVVYFNSLFSKNFTLIPLRMAQKQGLSKLILAPRGMLGKAALAIKPFKKYVFLAAARRLGWFKGVVWHASSELEKKEVQKVFGSQASIVVAPNISSAVTKRELSKEVENTQDLRLIFFSRINQKKNLKFAIQAVKAVKSPSVSLDIFGPIEDEQYWRECQLLMQPSVAKISYRGVISPQDLNKTLQQYHYLLFPTHHENYGHVIAESLCASLPVIISQNTPWRGLVEKNIGYDLPLKVQLFSDTIADLIAEEKYLYKQKVDAAHAFASNHIISDEIINQNRKLFIG